METKKLDLAQAFSKNGEVSDRTISSSENGLMNTAYLDLIFRNCIFENSFDISVEGGKIQFLNCKFTDANSDYKIKFTTLNSSLIISDCVFDNSLSIDSIKSIQIKSSVFSKNLNFGMLLSKNVKFVGDLARPESCKINQLTFAQNDQENSFLEIKDYQIGKIKFSISIASKVRIWGGHYGEIDFSDARNLKNLQIFGNEEFEEKIHVGKLKAHYLNLEGDILIKDAIIDNLDFSPFNFKTGSLRFQNVDFTETFTLNQSNLGKAQFIGVNFLNAKMQFNWSLFTEATFASIVWPRKNLISPDLVNKKYWKLIVLNLFKRNIISDEEQLELKVQREQYRQLKVISENNKNYIDSLAFYRNEMRVYWSDMRFKSELSTADHFLVFLNRYISNFGQNYFNPLILLVAFHLIFYSCILDWDYFHNSWSGKKEFGQFWYLLNPVHQTPKYINTGMGQFADFFMRIIGGYFIYHFVKATRKFGKV